MSKMKINIKFYRVVWTINALLPVHSEMLPFSGNNQNIKIFGVPPNTFAIGYVHNDNFCHWTILHYNMSSKTIAGRSDGVFWWLPALSEDQEKNCQIHQNYFCGFKWKSKKFHVQNMESWLELVHYPPLVIARLFIIPSPSLLKFSKIYLNILYFYN